MITDRTQSDVTYAKAHPDSATDLKGSYNNSDLNRVEAKVAELNTILSSYNYIPGISTVKTNWAKTDFFTHSDATRYLGNVQEIRNAFVIKSTTPNVPSTMNKMSYEDANAIEQILTDIEELIDNMEAEFRYSNTFYVGESEGLF